MKPPPEDVKLSQEDGEALIARVQADTLTGEDRRLLVRLIRVYFWLTFALNETRIRKFYWEHLTFSNLGYYGAKSVCR